MAKPQVPIVGTATGSLQCFDSMICFKALLFVYFKILLFMYFTVLLFVKSAVPELRITGRLKLSILSAVGLSTCLLDRQS